MAKAVRKKKVDKKFENLMKEKGFNQTQLREGLEKEGIYRDKMTISRWCRATSSCKDPFVCKAVARVLGTTVKKVAEAFEK